MSTTSKEQNPIHAFPSIKPAIVITESDQSLQDFLDDFLTVERDQAVTVLEQLKHILLTQPV